MAHCRVCRGHLRHPHLRYRAHRPSRNDPRRHLGGPIVRRDEVLAALARVPVSLLHDLLVALQVHDDGTGCSSQKLRHAQFQQDGTSSCSGNSWGQKVG